MIFRGIYLNIFLLEQDLLELNNNLNQELLENINNLKFTQDRNRRAFGYYLISQVIKELAQTDKLWNFSEQGKPFFPGIAFNVSHDNRWVVIVAQKDLEDSCKLGVDVCNLTDVQISDFDDYLTRKEVEWIDNKKNRFYMIWALKEAYTKGIGDGLGFDFKRLEFTLTEESRITARIDGVESDWDFSIQFLDKEHVVAIASNNEIPRKEFEIQNASQIPRNSSEARVIH